MKPRIVKEFVLLELSKHRMDCFVPVWVRSNLIGSATDNPNGGSYVSFVDDVDGADCKLSARELIELISPESLEQK